MSAHPERARPAPDRRSSTAPKRTSMLPKPSSVFLDSSVLIAQHAQLTGTQPITIGPNTVLHPHCKLSSALAPVVLGEGCVVFERARVGVGMGAELDASRRSSVAPVRSSANPRESMRSEGTFLGKNVVVESNAIVEAAEVGEGSVIEVGAVVGRGSIIGKVCTLKLFHEGFKLTYNSTALSHRLHTSLRTRVYQTTRSSSAGRSSGSTERCSYAQRYWMLRWRFMQSSWICSRS